MSADILCGNCGPGPQNIVAGRGSQSNLNGVGTQNNYYGLFQDPQAVEIEKLRREKEDCLRSLSFPSMHTRRQNIDDALSGTCDWLFSTTEFVKWRDPDDLPSHNGILWIKGKPGTGKSTLMNNTLSYCENNFGDLIMAYFFNARGGVLEKTPLGMMRSIVYQLLRKDDTLHGIFLDYYRDKRMISSGRELQWGQSELRKFMLSIVKQPQPGLKPLLLLVDALDECDEKDVRGVVDFFQTLSDNAVEGGVELRICLSSRHYPQVSMKKNLELIVERRQEHERDITTYVEEKLYTENDCIKSQTLVKANGIFMWVILVVAMLNKAYDEGRDEAMQKALDEVPKDLEGVFATLLDVGDSHKAELIRMLQWVLFSRRPLKPEELYVAAVREPLPSYEVIQRRITSSSKGLIEVRKEKGRTKEKAVTELVQFIHLSVNDFLCRNNRLETLDPSLKPDAIGASHARLWAYCWRYIKRLDTTSINLKHTTSTNWEYIMSNEFGYTSEHTREYTRELFGSRQFLSYATSYILEHADEALSNDAIGRRFDSDIAQWLAADDDWLGWLLLAEIFHNCYMPNSLPWSLQGGVDETGNAGIVYILANSYYRNLLKLAINHGADLNARGGNYGNVLQSACYIGKNYKIIELLLENGADINAQGGLYGNALQAACLCPNNCEIIKLLLENGANANAQGGLYGNALQAACNKYDSKIITLLLENGADVNAQGGLYGNALQAACANKDNCEIIELLLEKGANVNACGGLHSNALQAARTKKDNYKDVKLLLENGADINAESRHCFQ
ncbi:hypothetical protein F4782DRAFT_491746 [Xylaria castorea]|nr:hypothetical protein F4782DRAFT_491746 [Xylaria castorea]